MQSWYVVHTQPQKEDFAYENLRAQGFDVYLPKFEKKRTHARKTEIIRAPLFPRYVFVNFDSSNTQWRAINGTRGVISLITCGANPAKVHDEIIPSIKARQNESGLINAEQLGLFTVGKTVHITNGPFQGHTATLNTLTGDQRGELLINFMQRDMRVRISLHDLEAA